MILKCRPFYTTFINPMPIYATLCRSCQSSGSVFRAIVDRDNLPNCSCGGVLDRVLTAAAVRGDITPYVSPASGQLISSREQRKQEMDRLGYRTWEPGVDKDIAANKKRAQEEALKPIHETVDKIVTSLNTAGKLENINV
jgi:hypothetical protein